MAKPVVIGRVEFDLDGERTASLFSDGSWTIEPGLGGKRHAVILAILDGYSGEYRGPQDGFFGPSQLAQAASFLDGTVTLAPELPDDTPEGIIF
jgi:hypothetical protein